MNKTLTLMAMLLLGCFTLRAQVKPMALPGGGGSGDPTNYIRTDLISASPNAASIGRYGEVPVNLSTGTASLSIPIFTVQGNELSLPITLNYSFDGFKPAQPVSWIGLGWSLNAGGVISRTIKGRVDGTAATNYEYDSKYVQDSINTYNGPSIQFLHNIAQGNIDSEPDIYSFNFGQYSGKFIKFRNKYYCFPSQKLKIIGGGTSFTIITENGVRYEFSDRETTTPKGSSGAPYNIPDYTSSWYLTRITNAAGTEKIFLDYSSDGRLVQNGTLTQTYKEFLSTNNMGGSTPQSQLFDPTKSFPTYVDAIRLAGITSEKHRVTFMPGDLREDINQSAGGAARSLRKINVISNTGVPIKNIDLKQGYFGGSGNNNKYLKLDSLVEYSFKMIDDDLMVIDSANAQKHKFSYIGNPGPVKIDAWVDHYGFYTGKGTFTTAVIPNTIYPYGVDRSPVLSGAQMGGMNKVTYPTGGTTSFEYEMNQKSTEGGNKYVEDQYFLKYTINRPANNPFGLISSTYMSFTLTHAQPVTVFVSRTAKAPYADNNTRNTYRDFEITSNGTTVSTGQISFESDNAGKYFTFNLSAGNYVFRTYADERENMIYGELRYKFKTTAPVEGENAGGVRIKKIVSQPLTGQPITKEYQYTYPSGFTSGVSIQATYDQKFFEERFSTGGLNYASNFWKINNSSVAENYYMGVPHYYRSVLESVSAGTTKLSTRTDFKSYNEYYMGVEPVRITKYKNGANGELRPIERVQYTYQVKTDTILNAIRPYKTMEASAGPLPNYNYGFDSYGHFSGWRYLTAERKVSYEGTDSLEVITQNAYDVNGTKNLLWTQITDSRGKQQITRYKYPESYSSTLSAPYLSANVLVPVFEQQSWSKQGTDSVLVSAAQTEYNSSSFKPIKVRTLNIKNISSLNNELKDGNGRYTSFLSDTRYDDRVTYTYDNYGKIVRQQLIGGAPVSYKWAYNTASHFYNTSTNKTYVIAECKNATETEFYYEGFEEDANAAAGTGHTGYRFKTGNHTVSWTRPNSRAYVISYWYRSAGVWRLKPVQNYTGPTLTLTGGDAYDDIRIYPKDAFLTTYTHIPGVGLSSTTDTKDFTTYYEYDGFNRLKNVKDSEGNIVQNMDYRYAGSTLVGYGAGPYGNTQISIALQKNNCAPGFTGTSITYTVTAGKYKGATQAEADAYAQADLQANAQNDANKRGECTNNNDLPVLVE